MEFSLTSTCFSILVSYTLSQRIVQSPRSLVKEAGAPAALECTVEGGSTPDMYWYRQQHGGKLTQLSYSVAVNSVQEITVTHFSAERPTGQMFTLKTERLEANDTAVYYCAWSHTTRNQAEVMLTLMVRSKTFTSQDPWVQDAGHRTRVPTFFEKLQNMKSYA
ncbi:hypothetical protein NDU88_000376 [Pleurodeles waltl]|uniref:Ig-like domain-containing protein n=1 Tax=Pleurodeles waltl TaxID=8319 RepID=A0AAV7P833_PLEWA|nr:hypothetical protein NDU88_000376 [Pleurodeles waltl]